MRFSSPRVAPLLLLVLAAGCGGAVAPVDTGGPANGASGAASNGGAPPSGSPGVPDSSSGGTSSSGSTGTSACAARAPGPSSIVGTWIVESFDDPSSACLHIAVSPSSPILALSFAADGTVEAAWCSGGADQYGGGKGWCSGTIAHAKGKYTYTPSGMTLDIPESFIYTTTVRDVQSSPGGFRARGLWATLGWANFVPTASLP